MKSVQEPECHQCGSTANVREYERTEGRYSLKAILCAVHRAEHDAHMDKLVKKETHEVS